MGTSNGSVARMYKIDSTFQPMLDACDRAAYYFGNTDYVQLGLDGYIEALRYVSLVRTEPHARPDRHFFPADAISSGSGFATVTNTLMTAGDTQRFFASEPPGGLGFCLEHNEQTEQLARRLGLTFANVPYDVFRSTDSKITGMALARSCGVPNVPGVVLAPRSYDEAREAGAMLGEDLVVQLPFGCSGEGTFFISSQRDWDRCFQSGEPVGDVRVLRRLRCRSLTVEACATAAGTIVGPTLVDTIGLAALTTRKGGWCGNEVPDADIDDDICGQARRYANAIGGAIYRSGFRGYFGIDLLLDLDTGALFFGEINPRVTAAATISNPIMLSMGVPPMTVFHLLEMQGKSGDIPVEAVNEATSPRPPRNFSHLIVRNKEQAKIATKLPQRGVWDMASGEFLGNRIECPFRIEPGTAYFIPEALPGSAVEHEDEIGSLFFAEPIALDGNGELSGHHLDMVQTILRELAL